jgi:hypothetical protein
MLVPYTVFFFRDCQQGEKGGQAAEGITVYKLKVTLIKTTKTVIKTVK